MGIIGPPGHYLFSADDIKQTVEGLETLRAVRICHPELNTFS